jgi:DNA-directed RNA polymerase specialized sigma24 family protein
MLACVASKDRFRKHASFRTYVFTIARHELYRYLSEVLEIEPGNTRVRLHRARKKLRELLELSGEDDAAKLLESMANANPAEDRRGDL